MQHIHEVEFAQYFTAAYNEVKRCKLGLQSFDADGGTTASSDLDGENGNLLHHYFIIMTLQGH